MIMISNNGLGTSSDQYPWPKRSMRHCTHANAVNMYQVCRRMRYRKKYTVPLYPWPGLENLNNLQYQILLYFVLVRSHIFSPLMFVYLRVLYW